MESKNWLPQELILKILEELSLNSLCRFKSVSKLWNQLLSSSSFVPSFLSSPKLCFSLRPPLSHLHPLPHPQIGCFMLLILTTTVLHSRMLLILTTTVLHSGISCCSNGILCFLSQTEKIFFIGNPLKQKEFVSIPTPNTEVHNYTMSFSFNPMNRNINIIAFTSDITDYKKHSLWIYDTNWRSLDVGLPIYDRSTWEKIDSPLSLELELMDLNAWWYSQILEWNDRLSYVITSGIVIDGSGSLKAGVWVFSWEEKKWVQVLQADLKEWGLTGGMGLTGGRRCPHVGFYGDIFFVVAFNMCIQYDMKGGLNGMCCHVGCYGYIFFVVAFSMVIFSLLLHLIRHEEWADERRCRHVGIYGDIFFVVAFNKT
ncbi:hypothetical protein AMTRI_Chr07g79260 [Amborella trichopoda]